MTLDISLCGMKKFSIFLHILPFFIQSIVTKCSYDTIYSYLSMTSRLHFCPFPSRPGNIFLGGRVPSCPTSITRILAGSYHFFFALRRHFCIWFCFGCICFLRTCHSLFQSARKLKWNSHYLLGLDVFHRIVSWSDIFLNQVNYW